MYFVFKLFDHSLERLGASLSIFRERKDFRLEGCTDARNSVSNMLAFLEHKYKDCLNLNRSIKVFQLEVTLVEASENFASGQTENQFFERSLFRRRDSSRYVRDCDTMLSHTPATFISITGLGIKKLIVTMLRLTSFILSLSKQILFRLFRIVDT